MLTDLSININEISKEIQDILAKYNITTDLMDDVLQECSKNIKSRTKIKYYNLPVEIGSKILKNNILEDLNNKTMN